MDEQAQISRFQGALLRPVTPSQYFSSANIFFLGFRALPSVCFRLLPLIVMAIYAAPSSAEPIRIGVVHPHPKLCRFQEASQQDRRILRWVFSTDNALMGLAPIPWFFRAPQEKGLLQGLSLAAPELWGPGWNSTPSKAWSETRPGLETMPAGSETEPFMAWLKLLQKRIPGLGEGENSRLNNKPLGLNRFLGSRLAGTQVFPYRGVGVPDCQDWPRGTRWSPKSPGLVYRLGVPSRLGRPESEILAYKDVRALKKALGQRRLDIVWAEGWNHRVVDQALSEGLKRGWHTAPGGQQVLLGLGLKFSEALNDQQKKGLFQALSRSTLFPKTERGFRPLPRVFYPFPGNDPPLPPHHSSRARTFWFSGPTRPTHATIGLLNHPKLKTLAHAINAQWQRTLNLRLQLVPLPPARFETESHQKDLMFMVADLDDGSLQHLWETQTFLGQNKDKDGIGRLVFPLLIVQHFTHAVSDRGTKALRTICPLCEPWEAEQD